MIQPQPPVVSYEDGLGVFEQVGCLPSSPLREAVHAYVGYSHRTSQPICRREPARGTVTMILNLGPPLRVGGGARPMADIGAFVAPLHAGYGLTEEGKASLGLQVDLSPLGAHRLLGVPMRDLDDVVVELEDVVGADVSSLCEQLFDASGWAARFALLDRFFLGRLERAPEPSPDVVWAWRRLSETRGRLSIGALADELGCSRRHLVARFREQVGPAPKTAARILRFEDAARRLTSGAGGPLAEIAASCGYYDQSHFNRDFRELAGTTPAALLASRLPSGLGISG